MTESPAQEQRTVHYQGQVQGVGFRYTTRELAEGFQVTGFVQNLADGRVLLVAEGAPSELDRFLARVELKLGGYIEKRDVVSGPASGEYIDFHIEY